MFESVLNDMATNQISTENKNKIIEQTICRMLSEIESE